ncbi:MAG: hypothetical protein U9P10_07755 [Thermodesulfobacteriota bacterium]|nr:hypothetical protein [Thermodesulfobacteriota bacterium]
MPKIAVKSIRERFTIFRRGLLLIFILILVNILAFPFMGKMPKTVISIMVAAAAVIIGTAARPFIENFIAGVVISFSPGSAQCHSKLFIDQNLLFQPFIRLEYGQSIHLLIKTMGRVWICDLAPFGRTFNLLHIPLSPHYITQLSGE